MLCLGNKKNNFQLRTYLQARLDGKKKQICVQSMLRGGSRISGKGVHIYKGVVVCFADVISFYLNIP